MRNTTKSLANEYGITQKNMSQNPSMGIGMNPNLNIEDQYIENLLKQIHFLSMQTKLIKQKQKQNKGMGIMGLLNKDQNPVVTHAITSNAKFSQMKSQLSNLVNTANADYLRLDDENFAVKAQRDYLQKLTLKEQQKNIQNKIYVQKELKQGLQKLRAGQKKLQQMREENDKLTEHHRILKQNWEKMTNQEKTKNLLKNIQKNLQDQSHDLKDAHLTQNTKVLQANSGRLSEADKNYRSDQAYKDLVIENKQLKQKYKTTEKQLFDLNYKVKEMEQLKKLSIRNKDIQVDSKKQAVQDCDRMKKKLTDKKNDMETRLSDAKQALETNDEIRLIKGKIARKDKQTADIKKRTEASEANYKKLRDQVMKLQASLKAKKEANQKLQKQVHELTTLNNDTDVELKKSELDYEKSEAELKSTETSLRDARARLECLQEENQYLAAKQQHLQKSIDIDQEMKNVKIQQLTVLAQSNTGLNDTITDIMEKWQQIIKFSREPPSV